MLGSLGCSAAISGPVAPVRAGDVTVTVKQIRSGAVMIPTIAEQGNSVVSETNALVTTHVRNDSPQNPLELCASANRFVVGKRRLPRGQLSR